MLVQISNCAATVIVRNPPRLFHPEQGIVYGERKKRARSLNF